jgi:hypothetical protein
MSLLPLLPPPLSMLLLLVACVAWHASTGVNAMPWGYQ